jgi:hypothetical protein
MNWETILFLLFFTPPGQAVVCVVTIALCLAIHNTRY